MYYYVKIILGDKMFTYLTEKQLKTLKIFQKWGKEAAVTDFSIALGAYVSPFYTDEGEKLKFRTGWYWTQTPDGTGDARAVDSAGNFTTDNVLYGTLVVAQL